MSLLGHQMPPSIKSKIAQFQASVEDKSEHLQYGFVFFYA